MSTWEVWSDGPELWDTALTEFSDRTIYQSSAWAFHQQSAGWDVIRLACFANGRPATFAQVLIRKTLFGGIMAWIPGGPIGNPQFCNENFISCLKSSTGARFLYARLSLMSAIDPANDMQSLGWSPCAQTLGAKETLVYDLSPLEQNRRDLCSANWKRNLRRCEQRSHRPYIWNSPSAAEVVTAIALMDEYKDLNRSDSLSLEQLNSLIENLGTSLVFGRMDDADGNVLSIRAACYWGNLAWDMVAVTTPAGRKEYSSYEVYWMLCAELQTRGCERLDLSGVDSVNNPGVYNFKKGTGAKGLTYAGEWDRAQPTILRKLATTVMSRRS
jgi:lipid II:glycine glycyltransferase (peptidoglycan interpeptide bridge formation enzyme)